MPTTIPQTMPATAPTLARLTPNTPMAAHTTNNIVFAGERNDDSPPFAIDGELMKKIEIEYRYCSHLPSFDGNRNSYDTWRAKMTNWIIKTDPYYYDLLRTIEKHQRPVSEFTISGDNYRGWPSTAVSRALWSFLVDHIDDKWLKRKHFADFNGFELWRRLYAENHGNDQAMQDLMEDRIRRFRRAPVARKLC